MELELRNRIEQIKAKREKLNIPFAQIAENSGINKTSVQFALAGRKYYVTEHNISAIEKGMDKILSEYRSILCS